MRGPAFVEHRKTIVMPLLDSLEARDFKPAAIT